MKQMKAYRLQDGRLCPCDAQTAFPFLREEGQIVSLVGGGGKSTMMAYLADSFGARGLRAAAMTTTRILRPQDACLTMAACRAKWRAGEAAVCGTPFGAEKFGVPEPDFLGALLEEAQALVIEADGAHMRACKAPADHEPVILPKSNVVLGLAGVEVLGRAVGEACHRPQQVCALLGCDEDHLLTPQDLAEILLSERGARKGVGDRTYYAVINKCDDEARLHRGLRVLSAMEKKGFTQGVLTCFE